MERLLGILKIKPGEVRLGSILVSLMLFSSAGSALGGNAIEALFFARFGVKLLPYMYILLGIFTFVTTMAMTAMLGRVNKPRLYAALPMALGLLLIVGRLIILLNQNWFFAVMWLGMHVINSLQGLLTWGLASAACDVRQAKRLFPLFSAGGILGTILGAAATQPLARGLHSENLILIWASALFIIILLGRTLVRQVSRVNTTAQHQGRSPILEEMQRGYEFVRRSPIMQWISYSAILFSVCYFSLALPFSRAATAKFPDADQLAGFLGLFQSLTTGTALVASLFFANRLFARFGILPMLLLFPIIYFAGFGILAFSAPFALLVSVRFTQMTWMNGIAETAWQSLFNIVPPEERDQVRAFISGVPAQAGTFIAGIILVLGERTLPPQQLFLVGLAAAGMLVYIVWRASRAYTRALVEALRAGQPQLFFSGEEPFGGFRLDAAAIAATIQGLSDVDAAVRRISGEILGHLSTPDATRALVKALADQDAMVRAVALKGLARVQAIPALSEISARLTDPDAEVRYQAVETLRCLSPNPQRIIENIEPLLQDHDPSVRIRASLTLVKENDHPEARQILRELAGDPDPDVQAQALNAMGEWGSESNFELAYSALEDRRSVVRRAACEALADIDPQRALKPLILHLNEDDLSVRQAVAVALARIGSPALGLLMEALANPIYQDGALLALQYFPVQHEANKIRAYAKSFAQVALHYHGLALGLEQTYGCKPDGDGRCRLLIDSLRDKSRRNGLSALQAIALIANRDAIALAMENLNHRDGAQRANALETLEAISEQDIVRPLLNVWEAESRPPAPLPADWLQALLDDLDPWLRACTVLVAADSDDPVIHTKLQSLASTDLDDFVQSVAQNVLLGDNMMDSLATLSLMERILFLRRVPLFADFPPEDLKQVAMIASESLFRDGEVIARQGEPGSMMYIITSGEVQVLVSHQGQSGESEIARRGIGDYVGEMAIISQEPRIATLVAVGKVRTLCIGQRQFESIMRERPETGLAVARTLCRRLKEMSY